VHTLFFIKPSHQQGDARHRHEQTTPPSADRIKPANEGFAIRPAAASRRQDDNALGNLILGLEAATTFAKRGNLGLLQGVEEAGGSRSRPACGIDNADALGTRSA
jgi:hypothetical protein